MKWISTTTTEEDGQKVSDFSILIRAKNEEDGLVSNSICIRSYL